MQTAWQEIRSSVSPTSLSSQKRRGHLKTASGPGGVKDQKSALNDNNRPTVDLQLIGWNGTCEGAGQERISSVNFTALKTV